MNPQSQDAFDELMKNVHLATKKYFEASQRLAGHHAATQWTISLLSLGLILVPLLTVTQIPIRFDQHIVDFASIGLAVAVLMFSLLTGSNRYENRSEKMHEAGLDLNELLRDMKFAATADDRMKHYQDFAKRYGQVLRRCENNHEIDYIKVQILTACGDSLAVRLKRRLYYFLLYAKEMCIYAIALVLEFGFIGLLLDTNK